MSGVAADADDAVSRAMLLAWRKLGEYASKIDNLEAWLTRLACNVCVDLRRERRRFGRFVLSLDDAPNRDDPVQLLPSPEQVCSSREVGTLIHRAIGELPSHLREPARLRFLQEAEYGEIARRLAITPANARKRVQLARAILRPRLTQHLSRAASSLS